MGDRDLLKPLLERKGAVHFGRVLMKPGKPLTFATLDLPDARGKLLVFGLPGVQGVRWLRTGVQLWRRASAHAPSGRMPGRAQLLTPASTALNAHIVVHACALLPPCRQPCQQLCLLQPRGRAGAAQDVRLAAAAAAARAGERRARARLAPSHPATGRRPAAQSRRAARRSSLAIAADACVQVVTTSPLKLDPERPEYHRVVLQYGRCVCALSVQLHAPLCMCTNAIVQARVHAQSACRMRSAAPRRLPASCGAAAGQLGWFATTTGNQISSRLLSARSANALLELPRASGAIEAGSHVSALLIDDLGGMPQAAGDVPPTDGFVG